MNFGRALEVILGQSEIPGGTPAEKSRKTFQEILRGVLMEIPGKISIESVEGISERCFGKVSSGTLEEVAVNFPKESRDKHCSIS